MFDAGTVSGLGEEELLERFVAGRDEAAFGALLARHGPIVLGVCRRWLRDPRDVEDAFQATAMILMRKAGSIKEPHLLGPWLHGVAYRVAHRARKVAARRGERERTGAMTEEIEEAGRPVGMDHDLKAALDQEIDRLPESLRLAVVLCHLEGLTQPEAASRLRTTPDSIRGRLARAREKLRARLTRRGFALPGGLLALDLAAGSASAALPVALIEASLPMARAGAVPTASVAILTNGVIRAMTLSKLKTIAATILCVGTVAAAAAGFAGRGAVDARKAEASTPKVADQPRPDANAPDDQPRSIRVEARDLLTDAPIPDVKIAFKLGQDRSLKAKTDPTGSALVELPVGGDLPYFSVTASREGFVPIANRWIKSGSKPRAPDHFLFQMEKATTVGGRVLDQTRQPVADATVVVEVKKRYPRSDQWVDVRLATTRTDASGRWSFANVPAEPDAVSFAVYHPLHLTEKTSFHVEEFKSPAALRDGSAILGIDPRGTLIEGKVLTPDGRPVPGAEVFYGEGRRYGNSIPPIRTDSQGRFSMGIKPGTITSVTARVAGFGPVGQELRVGGEPKQVTLKLTSPRVLGGRVVDRVGKPIVGATVVVGWSPVGSVSSGRGSEAIAEEFTTDADGRFAWKDAPEGGASSTEIWANGYVGKMGIALSEGAENRIELTTPTTVKGVVIDGETGQPVPKFTLTFASVRNPGERLIWQRITGMDRDARKSPGSFEYTFDYPFHQILVRVEGEGCLPEDSELFSPDGTPRELTFRLTRSAPIRGTVSNPDGSPAREAVVYLVPANEQLQLVNGQVPDYRQEDSIHTKVAPDGRFSLPPRREDYLIFALSDAGIAFARRRELRGDDALRLRPWARVAGTVKVDDEPGMAIELSQDPEDDIHPRTADEPRFYQQYSSKTDHAGRFEFPRVAPGRHTFGQWVPNGVAGRRWFVGMASLDAESGRSYDLKIGESGRAISGKLALPLGVAWMIRTASIDPASGFAGPEPSLEACGSSRTAASAPGISRPAITR